MRSAKDLLERAGRFAPPATFTLPDVERTRGRRDVRRRITTAVVALALVTVAFGSVVQALRRPGEGVVGSGGSEHVLPPATEAPAVAGPGQSYYRAVLFVLDGCFGSSTVPEGEWGSTGTRLDATFVWSPQDDAGRIVVDQAYGYGIEAGRFGPGAFPNENGIDVSSFPLETEALTRFLLDRSDESGASPAPMVTPPPEGATNDGQLWRAITDLLQDPHVTPTVRAALLDVAAGLQGSRVDLDAADPFGRPAHVIAFGNWGGQMPERLYVDPATHELLAWTMSSTVDDSYGILVVQDAGVVDSIEEAPKPAERSVPLTLLSTDDLGPQDAASG
jgi:hypothetical protein